MLGNQSYPKTDVVHGTMSTLVATSFILERPVKTFTVTLFAKVMTERIGTEKSDERIKFSDSILERCAG